jgi:predicted MFS family arabinose efflux permease
VFLTRDLGGTAADVGVLGAFATTGAIGGRVLAALLAARFSGVRVLVAASMTMLLLSVLYTATNSVAAVAGVRLLHLAAFAVATSTAVITAAELLPGERRESALAAIGMAMPLSAMFFPAVAAGVLDGRLGAVAVLAAGVSLAAAVVFAAVRTPNEGDARVRPAELSQDPAVPVRSASFLTIAAATAIGAADAVAVDFLPVLSLGRGIAGYGWFYTAFALAMLAALMQFRRVSWQARADLVSEVGLAAAAGALGLLAVAGNLPTLLLAGTLLGIGFAAAQTGLAVSLAANTRRHERGQRIAALYLSFDIGRGVGAYSVGWAASALGFPVALALVAGYCGLHALGLSRPGRRSR